MKQEQTFTITYSHPNQLMSILEKKHNILITGYNTRKEIGKHLGVKLSDHQWDAICEHVWGNFYNHECAEEWLENLDAELELTDIEL